MAWSEPLAGQDDRRVEPVRASSSIGALPLDALYDILLRLPAKELCRLRSVCRPWRSLLSDPAFAAAYAARYPEPLIIVGYNTDPWESDDEDGDWTKARRYQSAINIMDLSGHTVKKVRTDGQITSMSLGLTCIKKIGDDGSCRLVNPASGAVHHVPEENPAYGYSDRLCLFGRVASSSCTREYKVLRKVSYSLNGNPYVIFEVCTIPRSSVHNAQQWRVVQDPPHCVDWCEKASVVIDGVVYFLSNNSYSAAGSGSQGIEQVWIVSFELDTEGWRHKKIRGPQNLAISRNNELVHEKKLSLANLNGSLVIVHLPSPCMDLWYLLDPEKGLWVKQYSVQIEDYDCSLLCLRPLIVLDDGRIVVHVEGSEMLEIYDPRTNKLSRVAEIDESCAVSVYTGTLLSLE
jgi:F-box interacting protein